MLVGRQAERSEIEHLLERAGEGAGGALVLRGEAGIGKTTLLEYAVERAEGFRILRALGVESEAELPFASLHELVRPIVGLIDELPEPQATALAAALALRGGEVADRFAIYAATLGLLAAAAGERPTLCVIDDAHWQDSASAAALIFAARRIGHDRAVMLFGAREPETAAFPASGVPQLRVSGLRADEAKALLAAHAPALSPEASARLVRITGGNPLALLEFAPALSENAELEEPLPVPEAVERAFAERWSRLSMTGRHALLLVAVNDPNEPEALWRALESEDVPAESIAEAERAGLLVRGGQLDFIHPLARSATYQAASPAERRAAHRAVGVATARFDRRVWHLAAAATGPNEQLAAALEQTAAAARRQGGVAAEAKALERAAQLTPLDDARAVRLLKAGLAAESAGRLDHAEGLLSRAAELTSDVTVRAEAVARRSYLLFDRGEFDRALELATSEAERAPAPSAAHLLSASGVTHALLHRLDVPAARATAERSAGLLDAASLRNLDVSLMLAWTWELSGRTQDALALAVECLEQVDLGTVVAIDVANRCLTLEQYKTARDLLERVVAHARQRAATANLAYALEIVARLETRTGRLTAAYAASLECLQLTEPLGNEVALAAALAGLALAEAMLGRRADASAHGKRALSIAVRRGDSWNEVRARGALGLNDLARGDAGASAWLQPAVQMLNTGGVRNPNMFRVLGDLIECEVRLGRVGHASGYLAQFVADAELSGNQWARAVSYRCRGLVAEDAEVEAAFAAALERHEQDPNVFERARTLLCHGERLRRRRQRRRAREQLHSALDIFERLGAQPWAERARAELRASGEHLRRPKVATHEALTPQELQVALAAAEGLTNKEIAARLFLSPKTVEFHLGHTYRKLGVRSRGELIKLFAERAPAETHLA